MSEASASERPATFREVFGQREFRAVFVACALSWVGDYIAKAAITVLVYDQTGSVALSAASFAVTFLPWVLGGPLLTTLADRHPYRRVMVLCDLARMVLIAAVAIPGLPIPVMLVLLFLTMLANPPAQAARSALMPLLLSRDRLVVGLAVQSTTAQVAQVGGYLVGAAVATVNPRWALLLDAATFAVSALVIRFGVRRRPAATAPRHRHLLGETADGFRLVFGTPVLRAIALIVFAVMLFAIVPEGLAAAWAARTGSSEDARGLHQAMILAAGPVGSAVGGLLIGRLVRPATRQRLMRPFALLAPLALVPALLGPPAPVVALMTAVSGFAVAGMMPTANGLFVLAVPHGFRARAFGVMQAGMQLLQGFAVLVTGLLAEWFDLPTVVGVWSVAGVALVLVIAHRWPSAERFRAAVAGVPPAVAVPAAGAGPDAVVGAGPDAVAGAGSGPDGSGPGATADAGPGPGATADAGRAPGGAGGAAPNGTRVRVRA